MKRVVIESPFAGDVEANLTYARAAMRDSILRGEAPFASHLLYTQPGILNDNFPHERMLGIEMGLLWGHFAEETVVYEDRGITAGMQQGIGKAITSNRRLVFRRLYA